MQQEVNAEAEQKHPNLDEDSTANTPLDIVTQWQQGEAVRLRPDGPMPMKVDRPHVIRIRSWYEKWGKKQATISRGLRLAAANRKGAAGNQEQVQAQQGGQGRRLGQEGQGEGQERQGLRKRQEGQVGAHAAAHGQGLGQRELGGQNAGGQVHTSPYPARPGASMPVNHGPEQSVKAGRGRPEQAGKADGPQQAAVMPGGASVKAVTPQKTVKSAGRIGGIQSQGAGVKVGVQLGAKGLSRAGGEHVASKRAALAT